MISAHEYPITANLIEIADMMILNRPLGWSICAGMPQYFSVSRHYGPTNFPKEAPPMGKCCEDC